MLITDCFTNCTLPELKDGDIVDEGIFLRNFNKGREIGLRYQEDPEGEFGYKVKSDFLKTTPASQMSVNSQSCTNDIKCSPLLQNNHPHKVQNSVAVLDLKKIREIMINDGYAPIQAVYKPITEDKGKHPGNPCHFDLQSEEIGLALKSALRNCLQADWIPKKKPRGPEEQKRILQEVDSHSSVINFHLNVVNESEIRPT